MMDEADALREARDGLPVQMPGLRFPVAMATQSQMDALIERVVALEWALEEVMRHPALSIPPLDISWNPANE